MRHSKRQALRRVQRWWEWYPHSKAEDKPNPIRQLTSSTNNMNPHRHVAPFDVHFWQCSTRKRRNTAGPTCSCHQACWSLRDAANLR